MTIDDFDKKGDFIFDTKKELKRGGMIYHHPGKPWRRKGLKVSKKFDNGNDDWLEMDGRKGEWAVAFHGISAL